MEPISAWCLSYLVLLLVQSSEISIIARSRQVCIYWLWKHCLLLSILPGDEQILIHIGNPVSQEPVSCE